MGDRNILKRFQLEVFPQPPILKTKHPIFLCHGFGAIGSLVKPSPLHDPYANERAWNYCHSTQRSTLCIYKLVPQIGHD